MLEVNCMLKADEPKRLFKGEKQINMLKTTSLKRIEFLSYKK